MKVHDLFTMPDETEPDLYRLPTHEPPLTLAGSIGSSDDHSSDVESSSISGEHEKTDEQDGHRPSLREMRTNTSHRSREWIQNRGAATTGATLGRTTSRHESIISRIRSRPAPQFTHPLSHIKTTQEELVDFDGPDDPYRPMNWPTHKKVSTTLLYGLVTMTATWASSAYSAGTRQIAEHFHVSNQVSILGTTLFLFGFGLGPLLWAPLSEVFGRRVAVLVPMAISICFSFGSAVAKDFQTLMLTRFFGAFFASAPVTNTGGVLGDLYSPAWRGIAMAGYAMAVVGGPVVGELSPSHEIMLMKLTKLVKRSHRFNSICASTLAGMALDRVLHRDPADLCPHLRHHPHRRELPPKAPRLQSAPSAPRDGQLGPARQV